MISDFDFELATDPALVKKLKRKYNQPKLNRFLNKFGEDLFSSADMGERFNVSANGVVAYSLEHLIDGKDYRVSKLVLPDGRFSGYGILYADNAYISVPMLEKYVAMYGTYDIPDNVNELVIAESDRINAHNELLESHKSGNKTTEKGAPREAFIPTVSKTKAIPVFSNSYKRTLDLSVPYTVSFRIIDAPIVGESLEERGVRLHTKYMDDYAANSDNELTGVLKSLSDNLVAERELTTVDFGRIQTADAAGYDVDGNPVVVEFKTGKYHYEKTKSAKNQLLRYAKGMSRVANFETISMVLIYPEDGMKVETFTMTLAEVLEQYPMVCIEQGLKDIVDNNSQLVADLLATKSLGGLRKSDLIELLADIKAVKRAIDIAKVGLKKFK